MDEQREYPFEFSVVMAVYNVEPFLREAVDSLITQDFGFEKIQLIMVDDGSTDSSGAICDEYASQYPENVVVIHKENGGVASARNTGLQYATGRYLNFMDSDDKFTSNVFRNVYDFFIENEDEVDVATIPLEFFDAQQGEHWQNGKFKKGTRVLDLYWDYQATIMFVNASFFASRVKNAISFDSHLVCGEDIKVLLTVLIQKMKLGVVTECKYMYRRRSAGEASLIQSAKKKYGWYFDYFTYLVDWAVDFYRNEFGYLPAFLQYELLCDLQWRFGEIYDMTGVLTENEIEQYKMRLFQSLRYFDDKYILEQKMIWNEHKCYMLSKKYDCPPTLTERHTNVIVHFGDTKINSVADQYSKIDFIQILHGKLIIEGYTKIFGVDLATPLEVYLKINDELVPCEILEREQINEYRFEELIFRGIAFRSSYSLNQDCEQYKIQLVLKYKNSEIVKRDIRYGTFSPIGKEYNNSYFYADGWIVKQKGASILVSRCGKKGRIKQERLFLKELWNKKRLGARKAVAARLMYHVLKLFKRKEIWLISDRIMMAGDNGEAFFRYMMEHHKKEITAYFVLSKKSTDYERMKQLGPVVDSLSFKHKLLHLLCDYNISSHADAITINPFNGYHSGYRDILVNSDYIFLQHGITKDNVSIWFNRFKTNMKGFVTSAIPEYQSIIEENYSYSDKEVWLTGMPRFDRLYHNEQRRISIMPSWRAYLVKNDERTGLRTVTDDFTKSRYFEIYSQLLNCPRLIQAAKRLHYSIHFISHPNMNDSMRFLSCDDFIILHDEAESYSKVFAESDLLISDYSSVVFDFIYLQKPVLYYQADVDEFFSGAHTYSKGYFDYERDGFGEVEYDLEGAVDRIIEYMENGCQLKEKYRARIDKFFAFNDQNNCQRVYEKILELDKRD